jgi:hypothetical protein
VSYVRCLPCVLLLLGVGCTTVQQNPARHPKRTGEPLAVVEDEKKFTTIERENLVDMGGSSAGQGSASAFGLNIGRDVEREHTVRTFLLTHAGVAVDEQDFYELAGDDDAVSQIERIRAEAVKTQEFWSVAGPLGIGAGCACGSALGIAGLVVGGSALFGVNDAVSSPQELAATGFAGVGSVTLLGTAPIPVIAGVLPAIAGAGFTDLARRTLTSPAYVLPVERARAAAAAYNARLAPQGPTSVPVAPVSPPQPTTTTLELNDATGCVDEAALRKDVEALAAGGNVSVRLNVLAKDNATRQIRLNIQGNNGDETNRVLDVNVGECADVPRVVARILRAHTGS